MDHLQAVVEQDRFARHSGLEIVEAGAGRAKVRMCIGPQHLNGMGYVHGGAIFTLADYAFAAACNSRGYAAVAVNANISYVKAAREGSLTAEAQELTAEGKLGTCMVRVTDDAGDVVAVFQGLSYRKGPAGETR